MEAKWIEISSLLRAVFKETEILKLLNVSRMTVHQVEERLNSTKSVKNCPRSGRPQVISQLWSHQKYLRKRPIPENDKTGTEEEYFNLHCFQGGQKMRQKVFRFSRKALLSTATIQKRLERSTRLLNYLKN